MADRIVTVDPNYIFPTPLEARLSAKIRAEGTRVEDKVIVPLEASLKAQITSGDSNLKAQISSTATSLSQEISLVEGEVVRLKDDATRLQVEKIQPLTDRLTVGNNDPVSLNNRFPGHQHANQTTGTLWTVVRVDGVLKWSKLQGAIERGSVAAGPEGNPNTWHASDLNGVWEIQNTSQLNGAITAGYDVPTYRAHLLQNVSNSIGVGNQFAFSYEPNPELLFRASMGWQTGKYGPWRELKQRTVESDMTTIYCAGESTTRGGDNGIDWDLAEAYPAKLGAALGSHVTVVNAGKGGAFVDETLMRGGRKRLRVRVPSGSIPTSGATPVQLSWTPETDGARWIDVDGVINGQKVIIGMNGTTGAWTVRRSVTGTAVPVSGWVEFRANAKDNEQGVHILWIGGNDSTRQVKGPHKSVVAHITAGIQAYKESLPGENHSLIVLGVHPSLGDATRLQDTLAVNAWCEENLPNNYLSVYDYMRGPALSHMGVTPTAEDQTLIGQGYIPRSVLAAGDTVHPSKAFAAVLAERLLAPYIRDRGLVLRS